MLKNIRTKAWVRILIKLPTFVSIKSLENTMQLFNAHISLAKAQLHPEHQRKELRKLGFSILC
jgi:hypothetical protein